MTLRIRHARTVVAGAAIVVTLGGGPAGAVDSEPAGVAAWGRYVASVEARLAAGTRDPSRFLAAGASGSEDAAALRARVGRGEIVVENIDPRAHDAGAATISHWRGTIFVPGATVDDLIECAAVRGRCAERRQEDVLEQRVLARDGHSLRLFLKLQRQAIITVTYNTEHLVSYERHDARRASSRSVSARIAELADAGTPQEREKPAGSDRGFLWRLNSYWRYEAAPGGVIIQLESVTLSRSIPWALRPVAAPLVDRIARESLMRTLTHLRDLLTS